MCCVKNVIAKKKRMARRYLRGTPEGKGGRPTEKKQRHSCCADQHNFVFGLRGMYVLCGAYSNSTMCYEGNEKNQRKD